jgi:hypothetical protein
MSHPFAYKAFMEEYFLTAENVVQANSTTECVEWVKLCLDVSTCSGPSPTTTQIHSVGAYKRDSGNLTMQTLEGYFTQALGGMAKYDPFMELNTGFYVSDLDYYVKAFDTAKVPYFPSTFTESGQKYTALTVQIPGSLEAGAGSFLLMEIVSKVSVLLDARSSVYHHPLPRFSGESLARGERKAVAHRATATAGAKPSLTFLKVSFASSDLDRDIKFFEGVIKGTKVFQETANGTTTYAGKILAADKVEVHFVHTTQKTQGPMSIATWEEYQHALHKTCVGTGAGFDRLADNHIGHMGMGAMDSYIDNVKGAGLNYRFYSMGGGGEAFFYFYWPNGWGSQFIGTTTEAPSTAKGYNFCTQGIKGHCSSDLASDDDEAWTGA